MRGKKIIINFFVLMIALFLTLLIVEGALRIFFPQYMYAASSKFITSPYRIFKRIPNTSGIVVHPDTGKKQLFIINEVGQHQHRHRNLALLNDANFIKIGIFGDSFTENMRIESQYSFVEILDYLLNCNKKRFEVYNFGVEGYGTDQSFIYYRDSPLAPKMNYVLYIFCANDIRNNFENRLFSCGHNGELISNGGHHYSLFKRFISKFYLTYFLEDTYYKLSTKYNFTIGSIMALWSKKSGKKSSNNMYEKVRGYYGLQMERDLLSGRRTAATRYAKKLFYSILLSWQELAHSRKAKFILVSLPRPNERKLSYLFKNEGNFVDLWRQFYGNVNCSMSNGGCQKLYNPWRFKNNDHWNEAGNLKAAIVLYRYFSKLLGLKDYGDKWLNDRLVDYYGAFTGGWQPYQTGLVRKTVRSTNHGEEIRAKYTMLNKYYHRP
ncbi:hypothetical protein ACOHYD_07230 [Desulfobacterota bacterium M19]